jgi:hypothetical protein
MFSEAVLEQFEVCRESRLVSAMPVSELLDEQELLNQTIHFAGSVLVERTVELEDETPINSLMDALTLASQGDQAAISLVHENVATDLMERTIKAGFVSTSRMDITPNGELVQHGQSYRSVQANSLRYATHPVMRERVWAETKNYFRLEELIDQGALDDYSFVVFSLAERDMPEHFYSDTQTLAIQASHRQGSELITDTAFVAGKDENGQEHDHQIVSQIYHQFLGQTEQTAKGNLELTNAEIIDRPLLVHNSLLPNGVIDLVKLYDDFNNGSFYGQRRPRQDYLAHQEKCRAQIQNYQEACSQVAALLIAKADQLDTPLKATLTLDQLSRNQSLRMAVESDSIDPQVFGNDAAHHILSAREAFIQGDREELNKALHQAKFFDTSTSCPGAVINKLFGLDLNEPTSTSNGQKNEAEEDKYGPLSFYCPKGHLNTRPKNRLIERCKVCNISVSCS